MEGSAEHCWHWMPKMSPSSCRRQIYLGTSTILQYYDIEILRYYKGYWYLKIKSRKTRNTFGQQFSYLETFGNLLDFQGPIGPFRDKQLYGMNWMTYLYGPCQIFIFLLELFVWAWQNICICICIWNISKGLAKSDGCHQNCQKSWFSICPLCWPTMKESFHTFHPRKVEYCTFSILPLQICCHCHLKSLSLPSSSEARKCDKCWR